MVTTFIKNPKQGIDPASLNDSTETMLWVERDRQHLEDLFRNVAKINDVQHGDFLEDKSKAPTLPPEQRSDSHIRDRWKAVAESNRRIAVLKDRYAALLSEDALDQSNLLFEQLLAVENMLHGFSLVFEEALAQKREVEAIKLISQGFELIADNLLLYSDWFIRERGGRGMLVENIGNIADINGFNEHFSLFDYDGNEERQIAIACRNAILRAMKSIQWELLMISGKGSKVPFFSDSGVVYLEADSAEGKALRRLDEVKSETDIDWIVVEPGGNTDFGMLRERMESRGYKVRSKNQSSS